jgi:exodeoxyribonuclease VII small subunit
MEMTYESAFQELQEIVAQLQTGDTSVDDLSAKAQKAAELIAFCKEKLRQTEDHLKTLTPD